MHPAQSTSGHERRWARVLLGRFVGALARLWISTLRLTLHVDPALDAAHAGPWVLSFWHGQQFALLRWRRRRPTLALVSHSRDGDLQAAALPWLGLRIERGSTSRGGARGLRAIVRRLRASSLDAAFAVDGPRGPLGTVHPGALAVARAAGGVVVPLASACASAWVLTRAWDRFELPRPFSRVCVVLGPPLDISADAAAVARAIDLARARAALLLAGAASGLQAPARLES